MRLQPINLVEPNGDVHRCPPCSTDLSSEIPLVSEMSDSLRRLGTDLAQVEAERPRLREYIDGLKDELENARLALRQDEFSLQAAVAEQDAADELKDANASQDGTVLPANHTGKKLHDFLGTEDHR